MNDKQSGREAVDELHLPLVEEEVGITKKEVTGRTVTVTTSPVIERQTVSAPVKRESVTVERIEIGRVIDAPPPVREEGNLTVIPVVKERVTIIKELVLVEEIHLRRTREEIINEQVVELRRTDVKIDG